MKKQLLTAALAALTFTAKAQLPPGPPVAHWDFNGGSTTELITSTPCPLTGTAVGRPDVHGVANNALEFWGGHITYNDPSVALTSWTIKAVVAVADIGAMVDIPFVWNGTQGSTSYYDLYVSPLPYDHFLGNPPSGWMYYSPVFGASAAGGYSLFDKWYTGSTSTLSPAPGTQPIVQLTGGQQLIYHCVVASYDENTNYISLYVDGVQYVYEYWKNFYAPPTIADLHLGAAGGAICLDDVEIYNQSIPPQSDLIAACEVCQPGLVAEWTFGDNPAVSSNDALILGSTVSPSSIGGFPYGALGRPPYGAIGLTTGSYLKYPYDAALDLDSWTIAAIVKPQDFWNGACQVNMILERGGYFTNDYYSLGFLDNGHDLSCGVSTPDRNIFEAGAAGPNGLSIDAFAVPSTPNTNPFIIPDRWYCVVASFDAANQTMDMWVDNIHTVHLNYPNNYAYSGNPIDLIIGGSEVSPGSFSNFFTGLIDDIRIYRGVCPEVLRTCGQKPAPPILHPDSDGQGEKWSTSLNVQELQEMMSPKLLPNPASDMFQIMIPGSWKTAHYSIINSLGAIVGQGDVQKSSQVDVGTLPNGLYVVMIEHNGKTTKQKLVVSH